MVAAANTELLRKDAPSRDEKIASIVREKMTKILEGDIMRKARAEARREETAFERMGRRIVDNLEVTVTNIHMRFEDRSLAQPVAVGVIVDSARMVTTDVDGEDKWVERDASDLKYKKLEITGFQVYWYNPEPDQLVLEMLSSEGCSLVDAFESLRESDPDFLEPGEPEAERGGGDEISDSNFDFEDFARCDTAGASRRNIVSRTSAVVSLTLGNPPLHPRVEISGEIEGLDLRLSKIQYEEIVQLSHLFSRLNQAAADLSSVGGTTRFLEYRPKVPVAGPDCLHWWHYARRQTLDRASYTTLYKQQQASVRRGTKAIAMQASDELELEALEIRLDLRSIMACRDVADAELDKEDSKVESQARNQWTLYGLLGTTSNGDQTFELTEEERQELLATIETPVETVEQDDYVSFRFRLNLRRSSCTLSLDDDSDVVKISFGVLYEFAKCPVDGSMRLDVAIQHIEVEDSTVSCEAYRYLVSSVSREQHAEPCAESSQSRETESTSSTPQASSASFRSDSDGDSVFDWTAIREQYRQHAFHFHLQMKPRSKRYDIGMFSATPINIIYNPSVLQRLVQIFETPMPQNLMDEAAVALEEIASATEQQLAAMVNSANRICFQAVLKAPIIVLPTDCCSDASPVLVMDFGVLSVDVDHGCTRKCAALQALVATNRPPLSVEFICLDEMSNTFPEYLSLSMTGTQVILSPTAQLDWAKMVDSTAEFADAARLVKKCSMEVAVSGRFATPAGGSSEAVFGVSVGAVSIVASPLQLRQLDAVIRVVSPAKTLNSSTQPVHSSSSPDAPWLLEEVQSSLLHSGYRGFFKCPSLQLAISNDAGIQTLAVNMREFRSHITTSPEQRAEFLLQRFDIIYKPEELFLARSVLDAENSNAGRGVDEGGAAVMGLDDLVTFRYTHDKSVGTRVQIFFAQFEVHWHPDVISSANDLVRDFVVASELLSPFSAATPGGDESDSGAASVDLSGVAESVDMDLQLQVVCPSLVFILAATDRTNFLATKILGVYHTFERRNQEGTIGLDIAIENVQIEDCTAHVECFRDIISSLHPGQRANTTDAHSPRKTMGAAEESRADNPRSESSDSDGDSVFDWTAIREQYRQHAFHFHLQMKPRSKRYDIGMFSATPINIIYNPSVLQRLVQIFETPMPQNLMDEAAVALEEIASATEQQLAAMVNSANRICFQAVLKAPIIVLPTDCCSDASPVLVMDFGVLSVDVDHGCTRKCAALQALVATNRPPLSVEFICLDEMSNTFPEYLSLSMTGTQVILSPTAQLDWAKMVDSTAEFADAARLVKKCSMEVAVSGRFATLAGGSSEAVFGVSVGAVSIVASPLQLRQLDAVIRVVSPAKTLNSSTQPVHSSSSPDAPWLLEEVQSSLLHSGYRGFFKCPSLQLAISNDAGIQTLAVNMREFRSHITTSPEQRAEFLLQRFDIIYKPEELFLARSVLDAENSNAGRGVKDLVTKWSDADVDAVMGLDDLVTIRCTWNAGAEVRAQIFFAQFEVHWHPDVVSSANDLVRDFIAACEPLSSAVALEPAAAESSGDDHQIDKLVQAGYVRNIAASMLDAAAGDAVLAEHWLSEMGAKALQIDSPAAEGSDHPSTILRRNFDIRLHKFSVTLALDRKSIYNFELAGARCSYKTYTDKRLVMSLELEKVSARHLEAKNKLYEEIVGMMDGKLNSFLLFQYESFGDAPPPAKYAGLKTTLHVKVTPMKICIQHQVVQNLTDYISKAKVLGNVVKTAGEQAGALASEFSGHDRIEIELHEPVLVFPLSADSPSYLQMHAEVMKILRIGNKVFLNTHQDGTPTSVRTEMIVDYCGCQMPLLKADSNVSFFTASFQPGGAFEVHAMASLDCEYFDQKRARWRRLVHISSFDVELKIAALDSKDPAAWFIRIQECERCSLDLYLTDAFLRAATEAGTALRYAACVGAEVRGSCTVSNKAGVPLKFKSLSDESWTVLGPGDTSTFTSTVLNKKLLGDNASIDDDAVAGVIFALDDFAPHLMVPIQQVGEYSLPARRQRPGQSEEKHTVLFVVSLQDGGVHISCDSTLQVHNETKLDLEVLSVDNHKATSAGVAG
eukprot:SAG11_NODE_918_length_6552_cov_3.444135_2_plen_2072_part_01